MSAHESVRPGHWAAPEIARFFDEAGVPYRLRRATALRGGYWNDVYRLETDAGRFVLKHYLGVPPDTLFPNLPDQEYAALRRLAGSEVAPEPVGHWPEHDVLIYRYVEGEPWDEDLEALAALLHRKEGVSPDGFRPVPVTAAGILAEGDRLFARCRSDADVAASLAARPAPLDIAPPARLSLIHTDVGPLNLIGAGAALRVVDWQCPAAGDLAEDVYSILSPAFRILNLREPLASAAIRRFFDALALPDVEQRHRALRPFLSFRMLGYCAMRSQTATEPGVIDIYRRAIAAELSRC